MTPVALRTECPSGKLGYRKRREALGAMNQIRAKHKGHSHIGDYPRSVYKCGHCRRWHMTKWAKAV